MFATRRSHLCHRVIVPPIGLVLLLLFTGCESWFGDDGKAAVVLDDAGMCVKDREELSEILVQPIACSTSDQCPGGAHCDAGTGQCDWDCFTDSDCGFGYTCTCDGYCQAGGEQSDAGPTTDPACPRDEGLLEETTRTNLLPYSSAFLAWMGGGTTRANVAVAPDGSMTADRFTSSDGFHLRYQLDGLGETEYTFSIHVKSETGENVDTVLEIWDAASATYMFPQPISVTGEWQRFSLTFTPASASAQRVAIAAAGEDKPLHVWGAQLEPGALGPYLPTHGGARTVTGRPIDTRSCIRDEHCPFGSRCDEVTRYCAADCIADTDCTGTGEVCDCSGACVVPGGPTPPQPTHLPVTRIEPSFVSVPPGDQWRPQTISVRIETDEAALPAGTAPRAYVEALNRDGLGLLGLRASELSGETIEWFDDVSFSSAEQDRAWSFVSSSATQATLISMLGLTEEQADEVLALRPEMGSLADFARVEFVDRIVMQALKSVSGSTSIPSCDGSTRILSGTDWVADPSADGHAVVASVSVGRCAPGPDDAERLVAVSTYLVREDDPDEVVAHLDYQIVPIGTAGVVVPEVTVDTGVFEGIVVVEGGAASELLRVPVHAWSTGPDALVLFDELGLLSASGRIELSSGARFVNSVDPAGDGSRGQISAEISGWTDEVSEHGDRTGAFDIVLASSPGTVQRATYQLRRVGDPAHPLSGEDSELAAAQSCDGDNDCPSGHACLASLGGVCVRSSGAPQVDDLHNTVEHPAEEQWRSEGTFLDVASYEHTAANADSFPPMMSGERLLCYDYPGFTTWGSPGTADNPFGFSAITNLGGQWLVGIAVGTDYFIDFVTGDLNCQVLPAGTIGEVSFTQTAVPLATGARIRGAADHPVQLEDGGAYWLSACLEDLAQDVPFVDDTAALETRVAAWFGSPRPCLNLAQVIPALGSFAHGSIAGDGPAKLGARSAGLFQRLMSQWLDVHALVAQQGAQEFAMRGHLDADEDPVVSGVEFVEASPGELLEVVERGWDLVLDPTYANAIASLPRKQLFDTDYRIPAPTAYWSFDAAHMAATSAPPIDAPGGTFRVADVAGDSHLYLSGVTSVNDHVRFDSATSGFSTSPVDFVAPIRDATVSFWVNTASLDAQLYNVFSFGPGLSVRLFKSSTLGLSVYAQHAGTTTFASVNVPDGWVHIAVVRVNRAYRIYVTPEGGDPFAQPGFVRAFAGLPTYDPDVDVTVLAVPAGFEIDELAIWDHALEIRDVAKLFDRGRGDLGATRLEPLSELWIEGAPNAAPVSPDYDLSIGLPMSILQTALNHAQLVESYADERLRATYGTCYSTGTSLPQQQALDRAGRSLRTINAADTLAAELYERSRRIVCSHELECSLAGADGCGSEGYCIDEAGETYFQEPAWGEGYATAATLLGTAREAAVEAVGKLARCENPLGIPEEDLPLYFGDVAGDNARFFASSDYLLDAWARPAVGSAMGALAEARSAWINQRDSEVRELMNEFEAERRLESLELSLVAPIVDACGFTDISGLDVLDAFNAPGSQMTVGNCYRRPDCEGDSRSCVRGAIGNAVLGIAAARTALFLERRQQERREAEWDAQIAICDRVTKSIGGDLQALEEYKAAAKKARTKSKGALGWLGGQLDDALGFEDGFFADIGEALGGCLKGGAFTDLEGKADFGVTGCLAGVDNTIAQQGYRDLDEAKDALNDALTTSALLREQDACWDQVNRAARDVEFGVDFARQQIAALEQARFQLDELLRSTSRSLTEATAVLAREQGRTLPSVAHHYWADEKIDRFDAELERARRTTFLAMRAVEYELQQSLGLRSAILSAGHPNQLEQILFELDAERGTRSINGRRPAAGSEVLSLRTDILEIGDLTAPAPGERADDSTRLFQSLITSPEYAVWDDNGNYLGQGIAFNVAEQGALRHRCAERLWRVNATIQGDLTTVEEPGTHVFMLKNNVFKSQWCEGLEGETDYQLASTSHTTNLLRAAPEPGDADRVQYTTAVLYPWFNVRRSDFYRDAYVEGASEELAGRGLYGEYILLFPYHGMLEPASDCDPERDPSCADFFRELGRVEDVLIRFDYYSVDNLTTPF